MEQNFTKEELKDGSFYDFYEAIDTFEFDFDSFTHEGLHQFIKESYLHDFIIFRKSFILRDFEKVRFYVHKFKGSFKLMVSPHVHPACEQLQMLIQLGKVEVGDVYLEVVVRMLEFFKKIIGFSHVIENPIEDQIISQFWKENETCNEFEEKHILQKIRNRMCPTTVSTLATESNQPMPLPASVFESEESKIRGCCTLSSSCLVF